jgi:Sulfotransferase family
VPPVSWKERVNGALTRTTGYQLQRARPRRVQGRRRAAPGDRLVRQPTFVLCTLRSGSTLLRVLLNSHSQVHAPHELHLRYVDVRFARKWAARSMKELGLDEQALEHLLWDRVLHRELTVSGKRLIVDKTPNNVFIADRLKTCWPDARFVFLLRHPGSIVRSRQAYKPDDEEAQEDNVTLIQRYCEALERARQTYEGHTVRYEDLTADPADATRALCAYLGVAWEPQMLEYGRQDHGRYRVGLGDWEEKIRTGRVQAPEPPPPPDQIPPALLPVAEKWGYLTGAPTSPASPAGTTSGPAAAS